MDSVLVYEKLQKVRAELNKKQIKKSGYNSGSKFYYYELSDFLTPATELFAKEGLCPVYYIKPKTTEIVNNDGIITTVYTPEMAYIDVYDTVSEGKITFSTPTSENEIWRNEYINKQSTGNMLLVKQNAIQNLGAKKTYIKRYLYLDVLDLSEGDVVDAVGDDNVEKTEIKPVAKETTPKATPKTTPKATPKVEETSDELISATSRAEIVSAINEKGLKVVETLDTIATELKIASKSKILESQKDEIIKMIKEMKEEK